MVNPITIEARFMAPVRATSMRDAAVRLSEAARRQTSSPVMILGPNQVNALKSLNFGLQTTQVDLDNPGSAPVQMGVVTADALVQAVSKAAPDNIYDTHDPIRNAVLKTTADAVAESVWEAARVLRLEEPLLLISSATFHQETFTRLRERIEALREFVRSQAKAAVTIAQKLHSDRLEEETVERKLPLASTVNPITLDKSDNTVVEKPAKTPAYQECLDAIARFREVHPREKTVPVLMFNPGHLSSLRKLGFRGFEEVTIRESPLDPPTAYGVIYADTLLAQLKASPSLRKQTGEFILLLYQELRQPMTYYEGYDSLIKNTHQKMLLKLEAKPGPHYDPAYDPAKGGHLQEVVTPELLEESNREVRVKILSPQFFSFLEDQVAAYAYVLAGVKKGISRSECNGAKDHMASLAQNIAQAREIVKRETRSTHGNKHFWLPRVHIFGLFELRYNKILSRV